MIDLDNRTQTELPTDMIERITKTLTDQPLELIICDNQEIQTLNKNFRNSDNPTDVLSFPYEPMPMAPLGSIIISIDFVQQGAQTHHHSEADEFVLLFLHGLLHLLGFDHEKDDGEMRAKEMEIITAFDLPRSLIVRND